MTFILSNERATFWDCCHLYAEKLKLSFLAQTSVTSVLSSRFGSWHLCLDVSLASQVKLLFFSPKFVLLSVSPTQWSNLIPLNCSIKKPGGISVLFSPSFLAHSKFCLSPFKMYLRFNSLVHLVHHPALSHPRLNMNHDNCFLITFPHEFSPVCSPHSSQSKLSQTRMSLSETYQSLSMTCETQT